MGELLHQRLDRHAVLQRERDERADGVHETADGAAFLRHGDEEFAGLLVVVEEADGEVALVAGDVELVGDGDAGVAHAAADRLGRATTTGAGAATATAVSAVPMSLFFLTLSGAERFEPSR